MFTKNGFQPLKKGQNVSPLGEVVVADPTTSNPSPLHASRPDCPDSNDKDIRDFKVFLKKNLAFEKPAPDLLVKIHQRIDAIKISE